MGSLAADLLFIQYAAVERRGDDWRFTWGVREATGVFEDSATLSQAELLRRGPPVLLPPEQLDALVAQLGVAPLSLGWLRERRLVEAIQRRDADGVRALLDLSPGAPLEAMGQPLVALALSEGAWAAARLLLERGAALAAPAGSVWAAADFAVASLDDSDDALAWLEAVLPRRGPLTGLLRQARAPRVAERLVQAGAPPDDARPGGDSTLGWLADATPLAVAAISERFEVAQALRRCGASLEARDAHGRTPLLLAVLVGHEAPVRWLLEQGAELDPSPDDRGRTPRELAQSRPDDPGSRVFLARGERAG